MSRRSRPSTAGSRCCGSPGRTRPTPRRSWPPSSSTRTAAPCTPGSNWGTTGANGWGNEILVARGDFYSDALAGCLLGHVQGGVSHFQPLLLTENPTTVGQYLTGFLSSGGSAIGIDGLNQTAGYSGSIQVIQALGGPLAVAFTTIGAMAAAVAAG